jgi:hypothetical protein
MDLLLIKGLGHFGNFNGLDLTSSLKFAPKFLSISSKGGNCPNKTSFKCKKLLVQPKVFLGRSRRSIAKTPT